MMLKILLKTQGISEFSAEYVETDFLYAVIWIFLKSFPLIKL